MATGTFTWTLSAFEQQGKLCLDWGTNAPFRAQQGQVIVYNGTSFPENPQENVNQWAWDNNPHPWNTGLTWGSDWYCAYIAQESPNGPYTYFVTLITTGGSNPDSRVSE